VSVRLCRRSFKFEIIVWGPYQETRIFAFSRLADQDFNRIAELLSIQEAPNWPVWFPNWPTEFADEGDLTNELERLWVSAKNPEYAVAADSSFETLLAAKQLDQERRESLPSEFDGHPVTDKFNDCLVNPFGFNRRKERYVKQRLLRRAALQFGQLARCIGLRCSPTRHFVLG
jgi:hypothetical protein